MSLPNETIVKNEYLFNKKLFGSEVCYKESLKEKIYVNSPKQLSYLILYILIGGGVVFFVSLIIYQRYFKKVSPTVETIIETTTNNNAEIVDTKPKINLNQIDFPLKIENDENVKLLQRYIKLSSYKSFNELTRNLTLDSFDIQLKFMDQYFGR